MQNILDGMASVLERAQVHCRLYVCMCVCVYVAQVRARPTPSWPLPCVALPTTRVAHSLAGGFPAPCPQPHPHSRNVSLSGPGPTPQALVTWRDPTATAALAVALLAVAGVMWGLGLRGALALLLAYDLRPPSLRDPWAPLPVALYAQLPTRSDLML